MPAIPVLGTELIESIDYQYDDWCFFVLRRDYGHLQKIGDNFFLFFFN
jgi:hypothetical protein